MATTNAQNFYSAFVGALVADAVAMPAHWYYDTAALDQNYGVIQDYQKPRNPHRDSILWRSQYVPVNERGDILGEQAAFWGRRGVHYPPGHAATGLSAVQPIILWTSDPA